MSKYSSKREVECSEEQLCDPYADEQHTQTWTQCMEPPEQKIYNTLVRLRKHNSSISSHNNNNNNNSTHHSEHEIHNMSDTEPDTDTDTDHDEKYAVAEDLAIWHKKHNNNIPDNNSTDMEVDQNNEDIWTRTDIHSQPQNKQDLTHNRYTHARCTHSLSNSTTAYFSSWSVSVSVSGSVSDILCISCSE